MATPQQNLPTNPATAAPTTNIMADIRDILNRLGLEADNFAFETKNEVKDYLMTSFLVLKLMFVLNIIALFLYRAVADMNADSSTWLIPSDVPEVNAVWYLALFVVLLSAICYGWVCGRLAILGFIVAIIERVAIGVGQVLSFIIPNRIENLLGNAAAFQAALASRAEEQALWQEAQKALRFYLNVMAWVTSISFTLLIWPWAIGFIPEVIATIGIIAAVAMTYGWQKEPFWLEKIKSGLFYFVGITTFCYLVVRPIFRWLFGADMDTVLVYLSDHRALIGVIVLGLVALVFILRHLGGKGKDLGDLKGVAWMVLVVALVLLVLFINPIMHYLHSHTPGRVAAVTQYVQAHSDNPGKSGYYELTDRYKKEALAAKQAETQPVEPEPTELRPEVRARLIENAVYVDPRTSQVYVYSKEKFHPVKNDKAYDYLRMMPPNVPPSAIGDPVEVE